MVTSTQDCPQDANGTLNYNQCSGELQQWVQGGKIPPAGKQLLTRTPVLMVFGLERRNKGGLIKTRTIP